MVSLVPIHTTSPHSAPESDRIVEFLVTDLASFNLSGPVLVHTHYTAVCLVCGMASCVLCLSADWEGGEQTFCSSLRVSDGSVEGSASQTEG